MKKIHFLILPFLIVSLFYSCKQEWLEAKPDKALVLPKSVDDYQLLLNNRSIFGVNMPSMTEICAGDFYLPNNVWLNTNSLEKNAYVWAVDIYEGQSNPDWINAWKQILQANIVLDGLQKLPSNLQNTPQFNSTKGQAIFYRAWCYFDLATEFCKPYSPNFANTDQGLAYRTDPDVNVKLPRGTLQQLYDNIIADFNQAKELLPETQQYKTQPTKIAVSAALARLYLSMEAFDQASTNARQCVAADIPLLDYNTLDTNATYPLPLFNKEVIWHAESASYSTFPSSNGVIDSTLFKSYEPRDLRKALFFGIRPNGVSFNGMYSAARVTIFCGLAMDEIYLIESECLIRKGLINEGVNLLNTLMRARYLKKNGISIFVPYSASDETAALKLVLQERRKELLMRNLRWGDLRRLNKDDRFKITLKRELGTQTFILSPNDPKYTLLIPPDEIRNGGIEQTNR